MIFSIDLGFGNWKLTGEAGSVVVPTMVSVDLAQGSVGSELGGKATQKPPEITLYGNEGKTYFVGLGAHDWGSSLEDLSYESLLGSSIVKALLYASLMAYSRKYKVKLDEPIQLFGALPYGIHQVNLSRGSVGSAMKEWMIGSHGWKSGRKAFSVFIEDATFMSQAHAAWADYTISDEISLIPSRFQKTKTRPIGVLSLGYKTMEFLVQEGEEYIDNLTGSYDGAGVSDLLTLIRKDSPLPLGKWDARLRKGLIEEGLYASAYADWIVKVRGAIKGKWGSKWHDCGVVIAVGGGAKLAKHDLERVFGTKLFVADDPITSISRGLYKLAALQAKLEAKKNEPNPA